MLVPREALRPSEERTTMGRVMPIRVVGISRMTQARTKRTSETRVRFSGRAG